MPFPVTRSILSAETLLTEVLPDFDIGTLCGCSLLAPTTNDSYRVDTDSGSYILRIYRAGRHTLPAVRAELDALIHLHRKGVPVSYPIERRDGDLVRILDAPEGSRYVALFTYAAGRPRHRSPPLDRSIEGRLLASIHTASDDMPAMLPRVPLDLTDLLDQSLAALDRFLDHRPEDWLYVADRARGLHDAVHRLLDRLDWGFCHGDYHGFNIHLTDDQIPTVFDFDCCGSGFRAWDLATYRWYARRQDELWSSFSQGYAESRRLRDADRAAIPLFVAIREIWLMGSRAANARDWGSHGIDERVDSGLAFLRDWKEDG